jgi:hypothetical protein
MTSQPYPWRLLGTSLLLTFLILLGLEFWRPYFFLTDDNLTCGLPSLNEIGWNLAHGKSPFVSQYIFNGNYNKLRDVSYLNWHPIYMICSLLANFPAPFKFCSIDAASWALFLLATAGFTVLAIYLRKEYGVAATNAQIVLLSTSFTWSMFALAVSPSWLGYTGSLSALPWLALGAFQKKIWPGVLITAGAFAHEILAGHPEPLVISALLLTLVAAGICVSRRSVMPMVAWIAGHVLAVVILLPILIPAVDGYLHTARSAGVSFTELASRNTPVFSLIVGYFLGPWAHALGNPPTSFSGPIFYLSGLAGCMASWCLIPAVLRRLRWDAVQIACVFAIVGAILLIASPLVMDRLLVHVPVMKSMKWPFRHTLEFLFLLHLLMLLRAQPPAPWEKGVAAGSIVLFVSGLLPWWTPPPTFNATSADRILILNGIGEVYWSQVAPLLDPTAPVLSSVSTAAIAEHLATPLVLIDAKNYGSLFRVKNFYGYSHTAPEDQIPNFPHLAVEFQGAVYIFDAQAIFLPEAIDSIQNGNPNLRFNVITIESLDPMIIDLTRPDGRVISLTPILDRVLKMPMTINQ